MRLLFGAAFVVCVVAAGITAKFDLVTLIHGLPRTTEFLVKLVPPIAWRRSPTTSPSGTGTSAGGSTAC